MEELWKILGLLSLPALVALNGFFVAAEFSLVAVRKTRIEELVARGVNGALAVQHAIEHLDWSIAATQLGITLSSIALGWFSEEALAHLFTSLFASIPPPWNVLATHTLAGGIAFFIITFCHVVFGELLPKTLALQSPDRVALWIARPLKIFAIFTRPLILLMNGSGNLILRFLGYKPVPGAMVHSVEELSLLIEDTEEAGILDAEQAELLQNIFALTNKKVRDCMVPIEKMGALELNTPLPRVLEHVLSEGHTRMPVYEGEINNIVGIVNTKDLFFLESLNNVVVLEDATYPALFLNEEEVIANALRLFRKVKRHMALVRNDAGKILGLITLEDVLEEIIGDIEDEQDQPQHLRGFLKVRRLKRMMNVEKKPPSEKK